ncbi:MAG: BatA and WFA domain-containing protein [Bacteroidales bacterium]|nr:BatA and WFA domain-containing protein [Bacteroidales bacterium]
MIFAAPAFLWGLLALAIPIAVHLFQFRRYRKVYFSNVERLEALQTESRRQSNLRRWLVLLMRCLAIVFLVLAFAQPSLPGNGQQLRSGATVVSVYLDNSFSMENSTSDGSQLEAAKQKAREIAAAYRPGDRYQLLSNAMTGDEYRWLSREEFLDAVDLLPIVPASRRLSEVAESQSDFMRQSGAANRHAYLVSDFQRSAADLDALPADSLAFFTLVPLEGVATDNIYIDTLRLDAPAYFVGGSVSVEATIRNGGTTDAEKLPVRLTVAGRERAIATLDIPAGTAAKATLRFTIDSAGWLDGSVDITDYPITFDDRYHFALLAGSRIQMLQVDGNAPNDNLRRLFADDSALAYQATPLPSDLSALNFIVLNEPRNLPSGQAQALASWVEQGGTLAIIPPADVNPDQLNPQFSIFNFQFSTWQRRPAKATAIDFQSSLYRGVFNGTSSDMEMPSVQGHYTLAATGVVHQDIITLADGSPLLCSAPFGDGRLYLFTSPLTAEWTSFVSQALFVPTLYNMALYSRPQPVAFHTLGDRSPIFLQGSYDPSATPPELKPLTSDLTPQTSTPSFLPDLRRLGNRSALLLHGELAADGIYLLGDSEHLAFNHPRLESQLDFLSRGEIEDLLDGRPGYSLVRNAAKPLDQEIRSRDGGTPLWHWCILLALAALLAETLLLVISKRHTTHS